MLAVRPSVHLRLYQCCEDYSQGKPCTTASVIEERDLGNVYVWREVFKCNLFIVFFATNYIRQLF